MKKPLGRFGLMTTPMIGVLALISLTITMTAKAFGHPIISEHFLGLFAGSGLAWIFLVFESSLIRQMSAEAAEYDFADR